MLAFLRKFSKSWFAYIIFGLLIVSFGLFWGVSDMLSDRHSSNRLATVGKKIITRSEFQKQLHNALETYAHQLSERIGKPVDMTELKKQALEAGLARQILHEMIQKALLLQEAKRLGIMAGNTQVREIILKTPYFQDDEGKFERQRFEQVLRANHLTEAAYVENLREELTTSNFLASFAGGVVSPQLINKAYYSYDQEHRLVKITLLTEDTLPASAVPSSFSNEELEKFFKENPALFTAPEYRQLTVLVMPQEKFKAQQKITEEELKTEYKNRLKEFTTPEQRQVYQIVAHNKEAADRVVKLLNDKIDPRSVPDLVAEKAAVGQEMGWVTNRDLPGKLAQVIFDLPLQTASAPLKTPQGFFVFIVEQIKPAEEKKFEAVKTLVEDSLHTQKARESLYELTKKIEDSLASGVTLEEASKTYDLTFISLPAIDRGGFNPENKKASDSPYLTEIVKAGFETAEGMDSNAIEISAGDFLIVHVNKVTPSQLKSFETAKAAVTKEYEHSKRNEKLLALATEAVKENPQLKEEEIKLLKQATLSQPLSLGRTGVLETDKKAPLGSIEHKLTTLLGSAEAIPHKKLQQVFDQKVGQATYFTLAYFDKSTKTHKKAYIIAKVVEKKPADLKKLEGQQKEFAGVMRQALSSDILAFFFDGLHKLYPVKIYDTLPSIVNQPTE